MTVVAMYHTAGALPQFGSAKIKLTLEIAMDCHAPLLSMFAKYLLWARNDVGGNQLLLGTPLNLGVPKWGRNLTNV